MTDGVSRVSVEIGGTSIEFETGKYAKQASGSVVVTAGETMVLCTATAGNQRDVDFLPLTVDVEERMYAAGKIPGSFFKREGRAGEKGTLTARMIDRPIRPLFPKGWRRETQLVAIPMSVDHVNPYDILAMNGASAALIVRFPPGARGSVRIGRWMQLLATPMRRAARSRWTWSWGTMRPPLVEAGPTRSPGRYPRALDIAHAHQGALSGQHDLRRRRARTGGGHPPQVDE